MSSENKMIYLDMNENQYGPAPACLEALRNAKPEMINTYSREKPSPIIKRLSEIYRIEPERILLGNGSEELLKLAFQVAASNRCKMMLPLQGWAYFKKLAKEVNSEIVEYPVDELDDHYEYNMEKILPIYLKEKPQLFLACCPNNPTGNSFTAAQVEKFLQESPDTVFIWDQAYYGYTKENFDEEVHRMVAVYPNLLVIRTLSKYYALAGMRVGYAFIGNNMETLKTYNDRYLGINRLTELITLKALDSHDYYRETANKQIDDRELFFNELSKIDSLQPFRSEATFFIVKMQHEQARLLEEELPKRGIKIKFMQEPEFKNFVRISLGTQEQNRALIRAFKELLIKNRSPQVEKVCKR